MATFKIYDLSEEDSLKLHITLLNLGDIDEQIHQLWQQVNFLLKQYCSHCQHEITKENNSNVTLHHIIYKYFINLSFYYMSSIKSHSNCYAKSLHLSIDFLV